MGNGNAFGKALFGEGDGGKGTLKRFVRGSCWILLLLVVFVPQAQAQSLETVIDTLNVPQRSSWEDNYLNRMSLDRVPLGARSLSMGGTALALLGGVEYSGINPAAALGVLRPELESEARMFTGGAGVNFVPEELDFGGGNLLEASNYRVRPRGLVSYNSLTLGVPVVILGNRGALAGSYRRVGRTGSMDETRVELKGTITNQAEATYGLGDLPRQGMDSITLTAAREITDFLGLGVNLNWESGELERSQDVGVSVFGFEVLSQNARFKQDISSFNVDVGARLDLGRLSLAGTAYLAHDIDYKRGESEQTLVPDPQLLNQLAYIPGRPLDHTLSVPTMFGFGSTFQVTDRLLLAGDYWIRPWSDAEITRTRLDPLIGFADPADSNTYLFDLVAVDGETETFNARMDDTNSLRLGLEYLLSRSPKLDVPIRVGFRKEKLTIPNYMIPEAYANYQGLVGSYWRALDAGNNEEANALGAALADVAEFNGLLFRGDGVETTTITFGVGVRIETFTADFAVERVGYDYDRFFLNSFDPVVNPVAAIARENRGLINLSLTTRMRF